MYPDIVNAIKEGLYKGKNDVLVVDTHQRNDFHADISIAQYNDARLLHSLRYFLELKSLAVQPRTAESCGQVLDYFHAVHEKQPHRSRFVGILSNFSSAWVYVAVFHEDGPKIHEHPCPTLADAIVYAETTSDSELKTKIPPLDSTLDREFSVLAIGKHYFLLSVQKSQPSEPRLPSRTSSRRQPTQSTSWWRPPVRHRERWSQFVLKVAHDGSSLTHEIDILESFRDAPCPHLPELVWTREGGTELGIVPIGEPVRPGESAPISRKIVQGMVEGLRYLHSLQIVHRDIRLSNLILKREKNDVNVVLIDYETAYNHGGEEVEYSGGYICWPTRLLQTGTTSYIPKPADDLFASILVVLHLLFPSRFDGFDARKIEVAEELSQESRRILQVWKDIESSRIWGKFYEAAKDESYDILLKMSDVFCHI